MGPRHVRGSASVDDDDDSASFCSISTEPSTIRSEPTVKKINPKRRGPRQLTLSQGFSGLRKNPIVQGHWCVPGENGKHHLRLERGPKSHRRHLTKASGESTPDTTGHHSPSHEKFDVCFLMVHGVEFSSQQLKGNLADFLHTLESVILQWFWEINLNCHVELFDWKSIVASPQYRILNRVTMPYNLNEDEPFPSPSPEKEDESSSSSSSPSRGENFKEPQNLTDFQKLLNRFGPRVYFTYAVSDILCYLTPRFANYIEYRLAEALNSRVAALKQDPRFSNTKWVLIGHSLGCILLYEILSGRRCRATCSTEPTDDDDDDGLDNDLPIWNDVDFPPNKCPKPDLNFQVSNFFSWGSPLAGFMGLANDRGFTRRNPFLKKQPTMRYYNVFHKGDPIAMRIEPLLYYDIPIELLPPPVKLPSFKTNVAVNDWRFFGTTDSTTQFTSAALSLVGRLFPSITSPRCVEEDPDARSIRRMTNEVINQRFEANEYFLPDPAQKALRYGLGRLPVWGRQEEFTQFTPSDINSKRLKRWEQATAGEWSREFCDARKTRLGEYPTPWTSRQLALRIANRIRSRCVREICRNTKGNHTLRSTACRMVETELQDFLTNICGSFTTNLKEPRGGSTTLNKSKWLKYRQWVDAYSTLAQVRREITREVEGELSEDEAVEGYNLPARVDFEVMETLPQSFIAPLGLLQSHFKYWSCRDTAFFILKEVSGFRPRVSAQRGEFIVTSGKEVHEKLMRRLGLFFSKANWHIR